MDILYLVVGDDYEWEDMKMFDNKDDTIEYSKKYPQIRTKKGTFLTPTYVHYQNGTLVGKFIN
jgi:hypothetical protein